MAKVDDSTRVMVEQMLPEIESAGWHILDNSIMGSRDWLPVAWARDDLKSPKREVYELVRVAYSMVTRSRSIVFA